MRINLQKFEQRLAEQSRTVSSLRGVLAPATLTRILQGQDVSARTVTKLAGALGVALYQLQSDSENSVIVCRASLAAASAAQGLTEAQTLTLAGVSVFDRANIGTGKPVTLGAAWRIADTLGVQLTDIL